VPGEWNRELQTYGSQLVVAVFDNWNALQTVLMDMEAIRPMALLHAR